jgi:hypothetical protein
MLDDHFIGKEFQLFAICQPCFPVPTGPASLGLFRVEKVLNGRPQVMQRKDLLSSCEPSRKQVLLILLYGLIHWNLQSRADQVCMERLRDNRE